MRLELIAYALVGMLYTLGGPECAEQRLAIPTRCWLLHGRQTHNY